MENSICNLLIVSEVREVPLTVADSSGSSRDDGSLESSEHVDGESTSEDVHCCALISDFTTMNSQLLHNNIRTV